jgi:hypothetical protein
MAVGVEPFPWRGEGLQTPQGKPLGKAALALRWRGRRLEQGLKGMGEIFNQRRRG